MENSPPPPRDEYDEQMDDEQMDDEQIDAVLDENREKLSTVSDFAKQTADTIMKEEEEENNKNVEKKSKFKKLVDLLESFFNNSPSRDYVIFDEYAFNLKQLAHGILIKHVQIENKDENWTKPIPNYEFYANKFHEMFTNFNTIHDIYEQNGPYGKIAFLKAKIDKFKKTQTMRQMITQTEEQKKQQEENENDIEKLQIYENIINGYETVYVSYVACYIYSCFIRQKPNNDLEITADELIDDNDSLTIKFKHGSESHDTIFKLSKSHRHLYEKIIEKTNAIIFVCGISFDDMSEVLGDSFIKRNDDTTDKSPPLSNSEKQSLNPDEYFYRNDKYGVLFVKYFAVAKKTNHGVFYLNPYSRDLFNMCGNTQIVSKQNSENWKKITEVEKENNNKFYFDLKKFPDVMIFALVQIVKFMITVGIINCNNLTRGSIVQVYHLVKIYNKRYENKCPKLRKKIYEKLDWMKEPYDKASKITRAEYQQAETDYMKKNCSSIITRYTPYYYVCKDLAKKVKTNEICDEHFKNYDQTTKNVRCKRLLNAKRKIIIAGVSCDDEATVTDSIPESTAKEGGKIRRTFKKVVNKKTKAKKRKGFRTSFKTSRKNRRRVSRKYKGGFHITDGINVLSISMFIFRMWAYVGLYLMCLGGMGTPAAIAIAGTATGVGFPFALIAMPHAINGAVLSTFILVLLVKINYEDFRGLIYIIPALFQQISYKARNHLYPVCVKSDEFDTNSHEVMLDENVHHIEEESERDSILSTPPISQSSSDVPAPPPPPPSQPSSVPPHQSKPSSGMYNLISNTFKTAASVAYHAPGAIYHAPGAIYRKVKFTRTKKGMERMNSCTNIDELLNLWFADYTITMWIDGGEKFKLEGATRLFLERLNELLDEYESRPNKANITRRLLTFRTYIGGRDSQGFSKKLAIFSVIHFKQTVNFGKLLPSRLYRVSLLGLALQVHNVSLILRLLGYGLFITYDDVMFIKNTGNKSTVDKIRNLIKGIRGVFIDNPCLETSDVSMEKGALGVQLALACAMMVTDFNPIRYTENLIWSGIIYSYLPKNRSSDLLTHTLVRGLAETF